MKRRLCKYPFHTRTIMAEVSAEILLAQKLAGNTQDIRDKAYRRLKIYIEAKTKIGKTGDGGFSRIDMLKLWKGLHFSMWMQDKPLLQEQLAENFTDLIPCFANIKAAREFIIAYFITECREWNLIDTWRIDKFSMLFRDMFNATLRFMKVNKWAEDVVTPLVKFLSIHIIKDVNSITAPIGLRYHLADIYLDELIKVCDGENSVKFSTAILTPWIEVLPITKRDTLRNTIVRDIFGEIIIKSPPFFGYDNQKVKVDYAAISEKFRLAAENPQRRASNRKAVNSLCSNFKDVSEKRAPPNRKGAVPMEPGVTEEDIEAEAMALLDFKRTLNAESRKEKKSLKQKLPRNQEQDEVYEDEAYESASDSDPDPQDEPPVKLAKVDRASASNRNGPVISKPAVKTTKEKPTKMKNNKKGKASHGNQNEEVLEKMRALVNQHQEEEGSEEDSDADLSNGLDMDDLPSDDEDFDINTFLGEDDSDEEADCSDAEIDDDSDSEDLDDINSDFMDAEEYEKLNGNLDEGNAREAKQVKKGSVKNLRAMKVNKSTPEPKEVEEESKNSTLFKNCSTKLKSKKVQKSHQAAEKSTVEMKNSGVSDLASSQPLLEPSVGTVSDSSDKPLRKLKVKKVKKPPAAIERTDLEKKETSDLVPLQETSKPKPADQLTNRGEKSVKKLKVKRVKKLAQSAQEKTKEKEDDEEVPDLVPIQTSHELIDGLSSARVKLQNNSKTPKSLPSEITDTRTAFQTDSPIINGDHINQLEPENTEQNPLTNQNNSNSLVEGIAQLKSEQISTKKMKVQKRKAAKAGLHSGIAPTATEKIKAENFPKIDVVHKRETKRIFKGKSQEFFQVEEFPDEGPDNFSTNDLLGRLSNARRPYAPNRKWSPDQRNRSKSANDKGAAKIAHFDKAKQATPNNSKSANAKGAAKIAPFDKAKQATPNSNKSANDKGAAKIAHFDKAKQATPNSSKSANAKGAAKIAPSDKAKQATPNSNKSANDKGTAKIAHFDKAKQATPKATVFGKASKKSPKFPVSSSAPSTPQSGKKRISFGGNSSVKKTAVKLRGSESHDPTRTPEQGILKVNPIEPGTVIQVGKQATIRNTMKNSKFPSPMLSSGAFLL